MKHESSLNLTPFQHMHLLYTPSKNRLEVHLLPVVIIISRNLIVLLLEQISVSTIGNPMIDELSRNWITTPKPVHTLDACRDNFNEVQIRAYRKAQAYQ